MSDDVMKAAIAEFASELEQSTGRGISRNTVARRLREILAGQPTRKQSLIDSVAAYPFTTAFAVVGFLVALRQIVEVLRGQ